MNRKDRLYYYPEALQPVWAYWMIMEATPKTDTTNTRCGALEKCARTRWGGSVEM
jgi:hypothetical protein